MKHGDMIHTHNYMKLGTRQLLICLRELIKLPHVRQLQESSLGLSRGRSAQARLDAGSDFLMVYTCFRDFEALRVDSQHHISRLPSYLPCEIDLLGADLKRSGGPQLGVLWEPQETPSKPQERSKERTKKV